MKLVGDLLDKVLEIRGDGVTNQEVAVTGTLGITPRPSSAPPAARVLSDFERLLLKSNPTEFERLVKQPTPTNLKIQRGPAGSSFGVGSVVLLGTQALNSIAAQTAAIETLTGVVELLDKVQLTDDCVGCLKKALWAQSKKQVKTTETVRKRV